MSLCESISKAGPRGSRAGPFCNDFAFCPVLEGCGTRPARVPCSSKKSCCLRGAGHAAPHSSLQVHPEAMWPNCVARVHAGPRRSEREGLESRGKSSVGCGW